MQMMLGHFVFSLRTASYQSLTRSSPRRIVENERVGAAPVLQDIGQGVETIRLPGTILPDITGAASVQSLDTLRAMKDQGKAWLLMHVDPDAWSGTLQGKWVIENIEETQSNFFGALPQKIEFSISLKRHEG